MNHDLVIGTKAEKDISGIFDWYCELSFDLGERFLIDLESDFKLLSRNPLHYELKYKMVRWKRMENFPFNIHYLLEENKVFVLAVLHSRRNPEIWKSR